MYNIQGVWTDEDGFSVAARAREIEEDLYEPVRNLAVLVDALTEENGELTANLDGATERGDDAENELARYDYLVEDAKALFRGSDFLKNLSEQVITPTLNEENIEEMAGAIRELYGILERF